MNMIVKSGEKTKTVKVIKKEGDLFTIALDDKIYTLDIVKVENAVYSILHNGQSINMEMIEGDSQGAYKVNTLHNYFEVSVEPAITIQGNGNRKKQTHQLVKAPMPGKIVRVKVAAGDKVEAGTPLVVLSAMKMENEIHSTASGTVIKVAVKEDDLVRDGQLLVEIG